MAHFSKCPAFSVWRIFPNVPHFQCGAFFQMCRIFSVAHFSKCAAFSVWRVFQSAPHFHCGAVFEMWRFEMFRIFSVAYFSKCAAFLLCVDLVLEENYLSYDLVFEEKFLNVDLVFFKCGAFFRHDLFLQLKPGFVVLGLTF